MTMQISQVIFTETLTSAAATGATIDTKNSCTKISVILVPVSSANGAATLEVSNDNVTWVATATKVSDLTSAASYALEDTAVAYRFYRILLTGNSTGSLKNTWLGLGPAA